MVFPVLVDVQGAATSGLDLPQSMVSANTCSPFHLSFPQGSYSGVQIWRIFLIPVFYVPRTYGLEFGGISSCIYICIIFVYHKSFQVEYIISAYFYDFQG